MKDSVIHKCPLYFRMDSNASSESDSQIIPLVSTNEIIIKAVKETQSFEELTKVIADESGHIFKKNSTSEVGINSVKARIVRTRENHGFRLAIEKQRYHY